MPRWLAALTAAVTLLASASRAHSDVVIPTTGTWHVFTRVRVTACASGQCASSGVHDERDAGLVAGVVVRTEIRVKDCEGVELEDFGDFVPVKAGVARLRNVDRAGLAQVLRQCSGYPSLRLRKVSARDAVAADGQSFRTKLRFAFTFRTNGQTVEATVTARLQGERIGDLTVTERTAAAAQTDDDVPRLVAPVDASVDKMLAR